MEKYPGYRKMSLRELQLLQLNAMKEIHTVCVKNNITYYIIAGTLLGAVRHGGFIPWDDDIDIAMMRNDFEKFKSIFSKEFDIEKYFLQHYGTDVDFRPALMRVCIKGTILDLPSEYHLKNCKNSYLDIFPLDNVPDDMNYRRKQVKDMRNIAKIIKLKLYRFYEENSVFKKKAKQLISFFLSIYPLKFLQKNIVNIMTRYDNEKTKCVASMASQYSYFKQTMDRRIYGNPILVKFEDTFLFAPENKEKYLIQLYGEDYMKIPPLNKQRTPQDVYILKK